MLRVPVVRAGQGYGHTLLVNEITIDWNAAKPHLSRFVPGEEYLEIWNTQLPRVQDLLIRSDSLQS